MSWIKALEKFNARLDSASKKMLDHSTELREEAEIRSRAHYEIKTSDFVSEAEERIMKEEAERESMRLVALRQSLDSDPLLRAHYEKLIAQKMQDNPAPNLMRLRSIQKTTLERARLAADVEKKWGAESPEFREIVEMLHAKNHKS